MRENSSKIRSQRKRKRKHGNVINRETNPGLIGTKKPLLALKLSIIMKESRSLCAEYKFIRGFTKL